MFEMAGAVVFGVWTDGCADDVICLYRQQKKVELEKETGRIKEIKRFPKNSKAAIFFVENLTLNSLSYTSKFNIEFKTPSIEPQLKYSSLNKRNISHLLNVRRNIISEID